MSSELRIYVDGGNRLTKVMQELKKPFSFPTIISQAEVDLNYGLNFDSLDMEDNLDRVSPDAMLVEIIKDGEPLGKKLVGRSAEERGLLIRDRNRYVKKAGDNVIMFSILSGIAYNLYKHNRQNESVDVTLNQPLIEYAIDKKSSIAKFEKSLKGSIRAVFYNIYNTGEVITSVEFEIKKIAFCPEAIASFFFHAIEENGGVKEEYNDSKKTIVWDIGSGQINIAAFENLKVVGVNTFEKGMMDCYEKISMIAYNNYRGQLDRKPYTHEIDNIIRYNGSILKAKKGEDINLKPIVKNVFDSFAYEISKDVREFAKSKSLGNSDSIIFCGGGSEILFDYLNSYLGNDFLCVKSNMGEFDNVIGSMYYRMYRDHSERNVG